MLISCFFFCCCKILFYYLIIVGHGAFSFQIISGYTVIFLLQFWIIQCKGVGGVVMKTLYHYHYTRQEGWKLWKKKWGGGGGGGVNPKITRNWLENDFRCIGHCSKLLATTNLRKRKDQGKKAQQETNLKVQVSKDEVNEQKKLTCITRYKLKHLPSAIILFKLTQNY